MIHSHTAPAVHWRMICLRAWQKKKNIAILSFHLANIFAIVNFIDIIQVIEVIRKFQLRSNRLLIFDIIDVWTIASIMC